MSECECGNQLRPFCPWLPAEQHGDARRVIRVRGQCKREWCEGASMHARCDQMGKRSRLEARGSCSFKGTHTDLYGLFCVVACQAGRNGLAYNLTRLTGLAARREA